MKEAEDCFLKVKNDYLNFLSKEKIFNQSKAVKIKSLKRIYIPISFWMEDKYKKKGKTLFLGLSGGQGSGKTTISKILKIILKKYFKRKIEVISIDNFYKTSEERNKMSNITHPLFKTRGVPGTHDINLINKFFYFIKKKKFKKFKIPKFSKTLDDRLKKKYWQSISKKPEIAILEGWCVGARHQSSNLLKKPINDLEKYQDKNMIWRKYVNQKLKNEYKKFFNNIDYLIFMKIPNFKMVFKWRFLQEKKLEKKPYPQNKIMSYYGIKRFIMFYERITLQMVKDLSKSASLVIELKKNHGIKKILFK